MARRTNPPRPGRAGRLRRVEEVSAGGLVVAGEPDDLRGALIGKLDRRHRLVWSLPKGHVEPGETLEQTAAREVEEETGITAEVICPLGTVEYWFVFQGRRIHKTVHHFLLQETGGTLSNADVEVTEVAWVPLRTMAERLAYPDERRLVLRAHELLDRPA